MTKKRLQLLFMSLSTCLAGYAQDPSVGSFSVNPGTLMTGASGTVSVNIGNGNATAIPQANNTTWTIDLPPNIGVVSVTLSPLAPTITTTIGTYSPTLGTTVRLESNLGPVPGNFIDLVTLTVIGVQPTGSTPAPISISASTNPPVGTNVPGNDSRLTSIIVQGPLPVALISFTANAQENRTVAVAWTTSLETNNKGFLVERSKDLKLFERVGEVNELSAMSYSRTNYQLIDQTPYPGSSYYRLTQTDLSGKMTTFPVASVVLRDDAYGVYPNPVDRESPFTLRLDEPETATVGFYGADGRPLPLQKTGVQSGHLGLKPTEPLSAGVYVLTVEERGQARQHRLVIQ